MALIKKLTRIGNSTGIIFPAEVLKVVGIDEDADVEISVRKNEIVVKPTKIKDHKVMKAFMKVLENYHETFKKLA